MVGWKDRWTDGRTDKQMDGRTDRWTNQQTDRWTDRWTDGPTKWGVTSCSMRLKNVGSTECYLSCLKEVLSFENERECMITQQWPARQDCFPRGIGFPYLVTPVNYATA